MAVLDYILLVLLICLGIASTVSDIKDGIIPNKLIVGFGACGLVLDLIYYGVLAQDVAATFLINVLVVLAISLCLYYTHALAGGDCKLVPVLSLLYPAGKYLSYGNSNITLFAALCFAILFGYIYLLVSAVWKMITGETRINTAYVRQTVATYFKSYIVATLYVMLINLVFAFINETIIEVNPWIVWVSCIVIAWITGRLSALRRKKVLLAIVVLDVGLSTVLRVIPVSLNPTTYIFTAVLLLCQMTIRTNLYERVSTLQVRKGMILSTMSSLAMQNSRIEGLPGISAEDLRSRLNENEAECVRRWGKSSKGLKEVTIVKKIPFAIFIAMGYAAYFILWGIVR